MIRTIAAVKVILCMSAPFAPLPALAVSWYGFSPFPSAEFHRANNRAFCEEVLAATDERMKIAIDSYLGTTDQETFSLVSTGAMPIGEILISALADQNPIFGIDSIPFLATSYDESAALMRAARGPIEKALETRGIRLLYMVPWPPQGIYTVQEIATVGDLKGLKFRVENPTIARIAELADGEEVRGVSLHKLNEAFLAGQVDVASGPPQSGGMSVFNHFYDLRAWLPYRAVVANAHAFLDLPEARREVILAAAATAEKRGLEMSRTYDEDRKSALAKAQHLREPSDELLSALRRFGEQMTEEWRQAAGDEGRMALERYRQ